MECRRQVCSAGEAAAKSMRKCMDDASLALKGRLTQQRYVCTVP